MKDEAERIEEIDYWWEGGFPGAFPVVNTLEPRLYRAFRRVLLAMPEEDFERFLELSPTIVCQPGVNGAVFGYFVPRLPDLPGLELAPGALAGRWVNVIYFAPHLGRFKEEGLTSVVAHETAHVILGHRGGPGQSVHGAAAERQADARIVKWGFKASYAKRTLCVMEKREARNPGK